MNKKYHVEFKDKRFFINPSKIYILRESTETNTSRTQ